MNLELGNRVLWNYRVFESFFFKRVEQMISDEREALIPGMEKCANELSDELRSLGGGQG